MDATANSDDIELLAAELTIEHLKTIRSNPEMLQTCIKNSQKVANAWRNDSSNLDRRDEVNKVLSRAEGYLEDVLGKQQAQTQNFIRVASIEMGVADTTYVDSGDLDRFTARVNHLFTWHVDAASEKIAEFHSPSFPMIQSSGMGKTKLMVRIQRENQQELSRSIRQVDSVRQERVGVSE